MTFTPVALESHSRFSFGREIDPESLQLLPHRHCKAN